MKNRFDLSNTLANSMNAVLNSQEHKDMFSESATIEKLAFKRVSEEDSKTEIEVELEANAQALLESDDKNVASDKNDADLAKGKPISCKTCFNSKTCTCGGVTCDTVGDKGCAAACKCPAHAQKTASQDPNILTKVAYNTLLKASEELEEAGFESLAGLSLVLIERLVSEAKAKKSKKDSKKSTSKKSDKKDSKKPTDSKKSDKKDSKKLDTKERMKKMRELKDKSKKSSK